VSFPSWWWWWFSWRHLRQDVATCNPLCWFVVVVVVVVVVVYREFSSILMNVQVVAQNMYIEK